MQANAFDNSLKFQSSLGECFSDLAHKSPELQEEFLYNAEHTEKPHNERVAPPGCSQFLCQLHQHHRQQDHGGQHHDCKTV